MDDAAAATAKPSRASASRSGGCPHVNRNDQQCATRFSLGRIDQAFAVCFGSYHGCPMYHRINRELAQTDAQPEPIVPITVAGRGIRLPLRATGT